MIDYLIFDFWIIFAGIFSDYADADY